MITYDLILFSKGEVTELARRNTIDSKYLLRTSRSDSMRKPVKKVFAGSDDEEEDNDKDNKNP
jgi:hypothetical protein